MNCFIAMLLNIQSLVISILTFIAVIIPTILLAGLLFSIYLKLTFAKRKARRSDNTPVIGIFHPYCNAGGGGERVLWAAIHAIQEKYPDVRIAVYTGDLEIDPEGIIAKVEKTFNIKLGPNVKFIYLHKRKWVEAIHYPVCTLLAQSFGSIWLGFEALSNLQPDIYLDTMGYAFTYPLFKYIGGCRVGSYTHYPTISTDMLKHVYRRTISHNNRRIIARNPFLTATKLMYYRLFALMYSLCGRCADIVMVNSSWTEEHINAIWKCPLRTHRIYPPCDVEHLTKLPLLTDEEKGDIIRIVSVGQFRPEKNHPLMLRTMYELRSIISEELWSKIRLILVGSCRNDEDNVRVKDMSDLSKSLALDENVEFKLNIPYSELVTEMQMGTIGLHAMWNEHFGISIVESMAAGLIMVAHNSGGPRADIIETQPGSQTGFLATEAEEYAKIIAYIVQIDASDKDIIRNAARASVNRFSCNQFEQEFLRTVEPLFRPLNRPKQE